MQAFFPYTLADALGDTAGQMTAEATAARVYARGILTTLVLIPAPLAAQREPLIRQALLSHMRTQGRVTATAVATAAVATLSIRPLPLQGAAAIVAVRGLTALQWQRIVVDHAHLVPAHVVQRLAAHLRPRSLDLVGCPDLPPLVPSPADRRQSLSPETLVALRHWVLLVEPHRTLDAWFGALAAAVVTTDRQPMRHLKLVVRSDAQAIKMRNVLRGRERRSAIAWQPALDIRPVVLSDLLAPPHDAIMVLEPETARRLTRREWQVLLAYAPRPHLCIVGPGARPALEYIGIQ